MNRKTVITLTIVAAIAASSFGTMAQVSEPSGQKTLAATMGVYVFPKSGQDASQQSTDEAACYAWAAETTKTDPFELEKQAQQAKAKAEQDLQKAAAATKGKAAKSAVRGAARGALIGEIIDDDAGKGAAYGATAGLMRNRRRARAAKSRAAKSAEQKVQAAEQSKDQQIEEFKKAFSVCLEAKDYMVKM